MEKTYALDLSGFCLDTARLTLKPLGAEHAQAYFEAYTGEVARYQYATPFASPREVLRFIEKAGAERAEGEALYCAITLKDGEFLGGLEARNLSNPTPELGIWLKKSAQNRGYAKEAMPAFLRFLREAFKINFFVYEADRRNRPSLKLAAYLNAAHECDYDALNASGEPLLLSLYYIP